MNIQDVKVGGHVSFVAASVTRTGVITSVDGHGNAVIAQIAPAIVGSPTITKPFGALTASK